MKVKSILNRFLLLMKFANESQMDFIVAISRNLKPSEQRSSQGESQGLSQGE
jgi:hypothetical protein